MNYQPAVIPQHKPLLVGIKTINADSNGRYSLNDLHRAAGGEKKHQPANWLRSQQSQELIAEINLETAPHIRGTEQNQPLVTLSGGNDQGTYACKELVYAYAMWISPAFHLAVIRAYDAMVTTPSIPSDPFLAQLEMVKTLYNTQQEQNRRLTMLEAKSTTVEDEFFTVTGYSRLHGLKFSLTEAAAIGRNCTRLSNKMGMRVLQIFDSRYGYVNSYHQDVLAEVVGGAE